MMVRDKLGDTGREREGETGKKNLFGKFAAERVPLIELSCFVGHVLENSKYVF